jgi:glucose-6-phosphate 1-dehydrogenase
MNVSIPTILIIIGVTGDLSKRKLLPALATLAAAGLLPQQLRIVGITRQTTVTLDSLLEGVKGAEHIRASMELFSMSLTDAADYERLKAHLLEIDRVLGGTPQRLWYLSIPPETAWPIIEQLGISGLSKVAKTKLLLEKPFGVDAESAQELDAHIERSFASEDVYLIDHYLAKEPVQDIIAFRRDNSFFEHAWNHNAVERIDIIASEIIGIEGRAAFYEQTGAVRDLIQSHLLQLAALTLMMRPKSDTRHNIPKARYALLKTLQVDSQRIYYGQYEDYRKEVANPASTVETFASLTFFSTDSRWRGVPITLTTGKSLADKRTEVVITWRPGSMQKADRLTLQIQPNGKRVSYEAYEHIFLAALRGDHTLFVSSDEVHESWRIIDAARQEWSSHASQLISYPRGATVEEVLAKAPSH